MSGEYSFAPGWDTDGSAVLTFTAPDGERGHLAQPLAGALCEFFLERHKPAFDLVAHLHRQRGFAFETFGPGPRTEALVDHIKKELREILDDPTDHREWIDVIILGFEGLLRTGIDPLEAVSEIVAKQTENEGRDWPDWRTADPNKAIEHDRSKEGAADGTEQKKRAVTCNEPCFCTCLETIRAERDALAKTRNEVVEEAAARARSAWLDGVPISDIDNAIRALKAPQEGGIDG